MPIQKFTQFQLLCDSIDCRDFITYYEQGAFDTQKEFETDLVRRGIKKYKGKYLCKKCLDAIKHCSKEQTLHEQLSELGF